MSKSVLIINASPRANAYIIIGVRPKEASPTAVLKSQQTAIEDAEYLYVFTSLRREMISHRKYTTIL